MIANSNSRKHYRRLVVEYAVRHHWIVKKVLNHLIRMVHTHGSLTLIVIVYLNKTIDSESKAGEQDQDPVQCPGPRPRLGRLAPPGDGGLSAELGAGAEKHAEKAHCVRRCIYPTT